MAKKRKDTMEFRFYEVPQGEAALILHGDSWVRVYGHEDFHLHFHNLMEIGICRYGSGDMYFDMEINRYQTEDFTIIPANFPHITVSDGEEANFWEYIFFDLRKIVEELFPHNQVYQTEIVKNIEKSPFFSSRAKTPGMYALIDEIIAEMRNQKPFYQKLIKIRLEALVMEMVRGIGVEESSNSVKGTNMEQIAAALDYINKNYSRTITASELARLCNMSETHFRRVFVKYINMPPMDYVNLIRVQKACDLMRKSNDSMDIVAQKCGFGTTSTFNRNFKKYLETSPYQWKINPDNYEHRLLNFRISAFKGW